jgi:uncharacterized repeat protein (TIGR01451 family)
VTDPMVGLSAITCPDTSLAPNGTETCTATYTTTQADVDAGSVNNIGTVTGTPPTGPKVTSKSPWSIPAAQNPALTLKKSASVTTFSAPGTLITYTYLVTNTGNVTLSAISINDPMIGLSTITCPDPSLAPKGNETCTATYTTTAADVTAGSVFNKAIATGIPPGTTVPVESPPSTVTIPITAALGTQPTTSTHTPTPPFGFTGFDLEFVVDLAVALMLMGLPLEALSRRRRRQHRHQN